MVRVARFVASAGVKVLLVADTDAPLVSGSGGRGKPKKDG
jgi:hypothetical protein